MSNIISTVVGSSGVGGVAVFFVAAPIVVFLFNYITSTIGYYTAIQQQLSQKGKSQHRPAHLPYTLPFFGSTFTFLTRKPAEFWEWLMGFHPQQTGAVSMLLGGKTTHLLFAPSAVPEIMKVRTSQRVTFDIQVMQNGYGANLADLKKFFYFKPKKDDLTMEKLQNTYLMSKSALYDLTDRYMEFLEKELDNDVELNSGKTVETDLYFKFVRRVTFAASTDAFFGTRFRKEMPNLEEDFYKFEHDFLQMFFGFPRWMVPEIYNVRHKLVEGWKDVMRRTLEECKGTIPDPESVEWEPHLGSRLNRGRQILYRQIGISLDTQVRLNMGFLFAASSNAIPTAGWVLFHLLDPSTKDPRLLPEVMRAIESARKEDGSWDMPKLCNLPLLVSVVYEVLRLYADLLIMRELNEDLQLPLDGAGKKHLSMRKGEIVFVPTYITHRSPLYWGNDEMTEFDGRRFLKIDAEGKEYFTTEIANGALLPWGGGKWICPGRVFVKNELLVTLAALLTRYDFKALGYLQDGKETDEFPKFAKVFPGSALVAPGGDLKVQIKRKS